MEKTTILIALVLWSSSAFAQPRFTFDAAAQEQFTEKEIGLLTQLDSLNAAISYQVV